MMKYNNGNLRLFFVFFFLLGTAIFWSNQGFSADPKQPETQYRIAKEGVVSDVWSGHPVGFAFTAHKDAIYIGYYNAERSMTIGKQKSGEDTWEYKVLPTKVGWDSHNYITLVFDGNDCLHVTGNMHCVPLIYFRAGKPNDIASLEKIPAMTGEREKHMTYPVFMKDKTERLLFCYRDGGSGNGDTLWNQYDEKTKQWTRLMEKPIFDGQKKMNAYPKGPFLGPDRYYHLIWVWRDTYDCSTNHDLSYARSKDMIHWEDSYGKPIQLPMDINRGERIAAIPPKGGLLNPLIFLGFDSHGQVIISYSKYDKEGCFQIWNARREKEGWKHVQASHWDYRWNFSGGGCIPSELSFGGVSVDAGGNLVQSWNNYVVKKSGSWVLDDSTLETTQKRKPVPKSIPELTAVERKKISQVQNKEPQMVNHTHSIRVGSELYYFSWDTLPVNRDRPAEGGAPTPSVLRVFKCVKN